MGHSDAAIDSSKLPERSMIDTNVLILALGHRPDDPQTPLCKELWAELLRSKRRVLIATPSIAELGQHATAHPPVPFTKNVYVVDFDYKAAQILGEKFSKKFIQSHKPDGVPINYMKWDILILACALRHGATLITLDKPMTKIGLEAGVKIKTVNDFTDPQRNLLALLEKKPGAKTQ